MDRKRIIDLCDPSEVSREVYPCEWKPRPNQVFVRMHPTAARGGILLGENSPAKADVATVQKSAVSWLTPGDVVVLRPFCGISMDGLGDGWWKIVGHQRKDEERGMHIGDSADWDVLMILRGGEWVPLNGWQLVKRDEMSKILVCNDYLRTGIVESGSWKGRRVALYDDSHAIMQGTQLVFGMDGFGGEYVLAHSDYLVQVLEKAS